MSEALTDVIGLLQPRTVFAKRITGAGQWAVTYSAFGRPSFCVVVEGRCRLAVDGHDALHLGAGDFVLMPATPAFTLAGEAGAMERHVDPELAAGTIEDVHHGTLGVAPDVELLGGYFVFGSPNADLLASLLPALVHVRGEARLSVLVELIAQESRARMAGSDLVLMRLVEVMLIEALRSAPRSDAPPGLLRGLADRRLTSALHRIHRDFSRPWTMSQLAQASALSRSAFYERFTRTVGVPPMEYLLRWRMAVAKDLLRRRSLRTAEVARRVGYGSPSTFSTAFKRHVGQAPGRYSRTHSEPTGPIREDQDLTE